MNRMNEGLAAEADGVVSEVEQREGKRFERVRIATRDGVAVAFYRDVEATGSGDATLLTVLLDEVSPGRWDALNASRLRAGGSRRISMRASERGDWLIAIYGSAPAGATVAVFEYGGREHRVPVEAGVFGFMLRAAIEPRPMLTRPRFE
jgi:hypothetical protein